MPHSEKPTAQIPKESSHKWITHVIEGVILVLALVLGLTIRLAVLETAVVVSGSMQPTLEISDRVLIDHRSSLSGKWRRGDILLFDPPEDWGGEESLTKRLIGLPGETIEIDEFKVRIDGRDLPEPYIRQEKPNFKQTIRLEKDQYFVMGDNRDNSEDSRDLGPIGEDKIRGRGLYRIFPIGRFGRLSRPSYPS